MSARSKILPIIRIPLPAACGALGVSWAGPAGVVIGSFMVDLERGVEQRTAGAGVSHATKKKKERGRRVINENTHTGDPEFAAA